MYVPEKEALVWKIRNFPGGKEYLLRCKFGLPSVAAEEEATGRMPPIRVAYEIPYFTVSGIQVRFTLLGFYAQMPERGSGMACPALEPRRGRAVRPWVAESVVAVPFRLLKRDIC